MTDGVERNGTTTGNSARSKQAPWREMGLTDAEYQQIVEILGREPNYVETGMFAVMWSEHCGYKNSRPVLKLFPTQGPRVIQGPGENAGVVDIGDGQAVVFKMESHNHPSAIEPFQGAATGVGGIVRDIFAMGARPIAVLDPLRFGSLDNPRVRYLFGGVVSGIGSYGNCLGIPTVGGDVYFEDSYEGNPIVNVMCLGIIDQKDLARGVAAGAGNAIMIVGSRTGRDGIHGATFASEELSEESESRRPSVQVGDPFMEKLLIEACLEVTRRGYILGMQDMGAAGITSSLAEMASRGNSGLDIDLDLVPRREEGMTAYEIMLSESQERMAIAPKPGFEEKVIEVFRRWGLEAVIVGRITDDGLFRVREKGQVVAEVPVKALTDLCPVYHPRAEEPEYLAQVRKLDLSLLSEPGPEWAEKLPPQVQALGAEIAGASVWSKMLLGLLSSPTIASKEWIYRQYDYMVRINTVLEPGKGDAAVLRVKGTKKGIAIATDGNGRYTYLDPFGGGAITVAEAARNLACVGAEPIGLTDCLNFGNPEKPGVFYQFRRAVEGMAEACRALEVPVVSGNVSFYNETNGQAVYPTPVVGMVGLIPDLDQTVGAGFKEPGDLVVLLGQTKEELGGSEYLKVVCGMVAGSPPELDLSRERAVQELCRQAIRKGLLHSAHDCSEGGLTVALAESCLLGGWGAEAEITLGQAGGSPLSLAAALFAETQSRILVSLPERNLEELQRLAEELGVPLQVLGRVKGKRLQIAVKDLPEESGAAVAAGEATGGAAGATPHDVGLAKLVVDLPLEIMERAWREAIAWAMS
ncbi:MAG: phosphoribosylformylglycinamidine synthase subunit PurL [Clostridia bacterium]|nr:phosphoribosylformylglycinamidine synthase subunit PurL [Clostridia bacterium]